MEPVATTAWQRAVSLCRVGDVDPQLGVSANGNAQTEAIRAEAPHRHGSPVLGGPLLAPCKCGTLDVHDGTAPTSEQPRGRSRHRRLPCEALTEASAAPE